MKGKKKSDIKETKEEISDAGEEKTAEEKTISGELEVSLIEEEPQETEKKYHDSELKNKVEAVLFSSGRPLNIDLIQQLTGTYDKKAIKNAIEELKQEYEKKKTSLMLIDETIDNKESYKLTVRENYMPFVSKIVTDTELSRTVIETLAIIAWKAPVKQSEVINIRTNKAYDHISELERLGFIIKEKSGRSFNIKLSQKFYDYFDLRNKKQLEETFEKVKEKVDEKQKVVQEKFDRKKDEEQKKREDMLGNLEVYLQDKIERESSEKEKSIAPEEKSSASVEKAKKEAIEKKNEEIEEIKEENKEKTQEAQSEAEEAAEIETSEENKEEDEPKEEQETERKEAKKDEVPDDFIEGPLEEVAKKRDRKKKQAE